MKKIVLAALLSLLSTNVFAIETVVADETVVTASRIPQLQRTIIADTTVPARHQSRARRGTD